MDKNRQKKVIEAQHSIVEYARNILPTEFSGKFIAKRSIVKKTISGHPIDIIINQQTFKEIAIHYTDDERYFERVELSKNIINLLVKSQYTREEHPNHGSNNVLIFYVFETTVENDRIEIKCRKTTDGVYAYYMTYVK
jgi:hypothetical protein